MCRWGRKHGPTEGASARKHAEQAHAETQARWPEVREVSGAMKDLRERNRFAEQIRAAMGGRA